VPKDKTGIERKNQLDVLNKLMNAKEIIILTGVRRCGKSTLIYQMINRLIEEGINPKSILYFNFDEILEFKDYRALDIVYNTFLEINNPKERKYVLFDEIQAIEKWEQWIKKSYDLHGREIKFILTGSNNTMLHDNLSKLLTGRIFTREIYPLSFREFLEFNEILPYGQLQKNEIKHHLARYMNFGGFPETVLEENETIINKRLEEYYNSILLRDIIQPNSIREAAKLMELAKYLMTNTTSTLSYNNIAKSTGLNITSIKEYISIMEHAYLLFQLNFFSYSLKESIMIQKPRKIHAIDTGLRNAVSFRFSKDEGKLAENLVFLELRRRLAEVYYWKNKGEIDFVIKNKDSSLTAINVSFTNRIDERELKSLNEFKSSFKNTKEIILVTEDIEKTEDSIKFVPLWKWLLNINSAN